MAIVTANEFLAYMELPTDGTATMLLEMVEKFVQENYCRRYFEETAYSKERYDGTGHRYLYLKNYPLVYVDRVSIGTRNVIRVKNTTATSTASVSVVSTGVRLVADGVANSTVLFATYTTLSAVATAINALAGWTAEMTSSSYSSFKSTELLKVMGLNVVDSNWVDLEIPEDAEDDFRVYEKEGIIYSPFKWPICSQCIIVDYTAGYTTATMPKDLKAAIMLFAKFLYDRLSENLVNVSHYTVENMVQIFEKEDFPKEIRLILNKYKRTLF